MTLPARVSESWLSGLAACNTAQYRRKVKEGGRPVFSLTPSATEEVPEWWFLVADREGAIFRVTSNASPFCRRTDSLKVVYRTARVAGLETLILPIETKGKR